MRQEFLNLLNDIDLDSLKGLEGRSNKEIKEGFLQSSSSSIPDEMRLEWSVLDAYDTFATKIEKNYHEEEVIKKFHSTGFLDIKNNNIPIAISGLKPK